MLHIKSHIKTTNIIKEIIRYARTNSKSSKKIDPGISLRSKLFTNQQESSLETLDYDSLETDFNDLNMTHKEHVQEIEAMKEKEKFHIVKQKYFKETLPNFLTWADKQQIKHLYNTNPDEWSVDKLSEGFPALPETIQKIIKSNWVKKNNNKIHNHDESVKTNWNLFKTGKIVDVLPTNLINHLNKFSNRKLKFNSFDAKAEVEIIPKIAMAQGEFSEIITSYEKLRNKNVEPNLLINNNEEINKKPLKETYVTINNADYEINQSMTLSAYKNVLKDKLEQGSDDKLILSAKDKFVQRIEHKEIHLDSAKYSNRNGDILLYKKATNNTKHLEYPEKILIPKGTHKKGNTYKLNDCYYDDDGEFLYRVPGMG